AGDVVAYWTQGFADSPWATCCRPLRGLVTSLRMDPGLRGLALGYMLSPASRAGDVVAYWTQGFAGSPWATCCRPLRGLVTLLMEVSVSIDRRTPSIVYGIHI